jgi:DNA-binding MarR family transcriptional regulator
MKENINNKIVETMFFVFRLMQDKMKFDSKTSFLTMFQFELLICIKRNKKVTMSELAKYFSISMPTVTVHINKLIASKLVKRKQIKNDRRVTQISLTTKGQSVLNKASKQRKTKITKLLSYLSPGDAKNLLQIMENLKKEVEKNNE